MSKLENGKAKCGGEKRKKIDMEGRKKERKNGLKEEWTKERKKEEQIVKDP